MSSIGLYDIAFAAIADAARFRAFLESTEPILPIPLDLVLWYTKLKSQKGQGWRG